MSVNIYENGELRTLSTGYTVPVGGKGGALIGEIKAYAGTSIPAGWLECDGSEVAKADYPILYAAIGDLWGTPSDSDHFLLPDFRGRVPIGSGLGTASDATDRVVGTMGGSERITLAIGQIPAHNHGQSTLTGTVGNFFGSGQATTSNGILRKNYSSGRQYKTDGTSTNGWYTLTATATHTHTTQGNGESHGNMQPYAVVKYIICAI